MKDLALNPREFFEPALPGMEEIEQFNSFKLEKVRPLCSFFTKPVQNTMPSRQVTILEVYNLITGDQYKGYTKVLRSLSNPLSARNYKGRSFDYVTFSGLFYKRAELGLIQHSGLLTLDFDHVPYPDKLKIRLIQDASFETALCFISPSGDGLKWIVSINIQQFTHLQWFTGISNYVKNIYHLEVDKSGKDVSRCCFLPYDGQAYINPKYM